MSIAFALHALNKHELNYSTMELECLAMVFAFTKFQQYLEHRHFQLFTDNFSLPSLLNHPRQVTKLARWIEFINFFKFKVEHIKGADSMQQLFESGEPTNISFNEISTKHPPPPPRQPHFYPPCKLPSKTFKPKKVKTLKFQKC